MKSFFGILTAAFLGFFPGIFPENPEPLIAFSPRENREFLPRPSDADFSIEIFLTTDSEISRRFFENSAVPLKNLLLEKSFPVAVIFRFLPTDDFSKKQIRDLACVEKFSKKWENWLAAREILNSRKISAEIFGNFADDFQKCRADETFDPAAENAAIARAAGISKIPTIKIGKRFLVGAMPPENLFFEIQKHFSPR